MCTVVQTSTVVDVTVIFFRQVIDVPLVIYYHIILLWRVQNIIMKQHSTLEIIINKSPNAVRPRCSRVNNMKTASTQTRRKQCSAV